MYYGYHQRIRQRIDAGELTGAYETDDYPRIGTALVLVFKAAPFLRPIRPHRWAEYLELLGRLGIEPKRLEIVPKLETKVMIEEPKMDRMRMEMLVNGRLDGTCMVALQYETDGIGHSERKEHES